MTQAALREIEAQFSSSPRERPWLFAFLISPDAVLSLGLFGGALAFLLRNEGVGPARAASIVSLLMLPHSIYFLWGPVTDFWMRRRTWLVLAAVATACAILLAFAGDRLGSRRGVALLFAAACLGVVIPAACGGIMGTLRSEVNRRRAGSFYQTGSLAIGAIAVFALVSLARLKLIQLGLILAALIVLPALAALAVPERRRPGDAAANAGAVAARIWSEFRATFLRWKAIPYTVLIVFPAGSGAMIGLLPALARDYGVGGAAVAWINGVGGALLTAAGSMAAALIPARIRAPIAYSAVVLTNAATLVLLALGPMRPWLYEAGTVLFLFTIGAGYALFTAVSLEFMGDSGQSGSARYAIINSLGNLPVAYMTWIDGRGYALWGPRAMPGIDAALSTVAAALMTTHFVVSRRGKVRR